MNVPEDITADVLLGAIALEVKAINAGAEDADERRKRVDLYCIHLLKLSRPDLFDEGATNE